MEKEFFDVFPVLKLKDQLKEWLEMVTGSKVTCNHAKTRLWVYIQSERWIHKKFIFALEDHFDRFYNSCRLLRIPFQYSREELEKILETLSKSGLYGLILRAKGIIQNTDGSWMEFDFVPEEYEIREGNPDYTGRLCVIGSLLDEDGLKELFGV